MTANKPAIPLAALLAAVLLTLDAPRASATLSKAATFDEKVSNAAAIVLGRALRKESHWDAEHRWILTSTTFRIEKAYKGLPGQQEITVVTPGGRVGDVNQDTEGVPDFVEGAEHVLFIRNSSAGPTVLFFDQGAYDVGRSGNERVVRPVATDAVELDTQRGMAVAPEVPRTLAQFERAVGDAERRATFNRMEMVRRQQTQQTSLSAILSRYRFVVVIALLGIALATWRLIRR